MQGRITLDFCVLCFSLRPISTVANRMRTIAMRFSPVRKVPVCCERSFANGSSCSILDHSGNKIIARAIKLDIFKAEWDADLVEVLIKKIKSSKICTGMFTIGLQHKNLAFD